MKSNHRAAAVIIPASPWDWSRDWIRQCAPWFAAAPDREKSRQTRSALDFSVPICYDTKVTARTRNSTPPTLCRENRRSVQAWAGGGGTHL